jgi:hypothetical protein
VTIPKGVTSFWYSNRTVTLVRCTAERPYIFRPSGRLIAATQQSASDLFRSLGSQPAQGVPRTSHQLLPTSPPQITSPLYSTVTCLGRTRCRPTVHSARGELRTSHQLLPDSPHYSTVTRLGQSRCRPTVHFAPVLHNAERNNWQINYTTTIHAV